MRIWVISKGSHALEEIPASPEAFAYLALYLDEHGLPQEDQPVWRARHGRPRPLSYSATRAVLNRANAKLSTNWRPHDLRHTAATRMAGDPELSIVEVQAVLRHRHLSTTERYTRVRVEELIDKVQQHYARPQVERHFTPGYDPADIQAVFRWLTPRPGGPSSGPPHRRRQSRGDGAASREPPRPRPLPPRVLAVTWPAATGPGSSRRAARDTRDVPLRPTGPPTTTLNRAQRPDQRLKVELKLRGRDVDVG